MISNPVAANREKAVYLMANIICCPIAILEMM
jgi:hypothetical protein